MSTFVIGEAASCHDGSLDRAKRLIDVAYRAGADAVKFQFWSDADQLADRRRATDAYREIYRRYQMPDAWLEPLSRYCGRVIELMVTCFLPQDVAVVAPFVRRFKIASFEAQDPELAAAHVSFAKPTIISTGMTGKRWVVFSTGGAQQLLHCVSAYPAPIAETNLAVLRDSSLEGLSDHSKQVDMGALAVAAGAKVIEAHIRLRDTAVENPDCAVAFDPDEFDHYVRLIRRAEAIMGTGIKLVQPSEAAMLPFKVDR